jgi:DNA-binding PadR family transcriptional regulator
MFAEHALLPAQAVRLTALGMLAEGPRRYADLAREVSHFTGCILGQSLDVMGTSLELLRYEGLIEARGGTGMVDNAEMGITAAGSRALARLLKAPLQAPSVEVNRLVLALKLRFLPILDEAGRGEVLAQIREWYAGEIVRYEELRARHGAHSAPFCRWLDREIALARERLREISALSSPGAGDAGQPPNVTPTNRPTP